MSEHKFFDFGITMQLSTTAAQRLMLAAMGLDKWPQRPATKEDVRDLIRNMGALQIDTINVVARSPYLVLWSRLGDYDPRWLDELLAEGQDIRVLVARRLLFAHRGLPALPAHAARPRVGSR